MTLRAFSLVLASALLFSRAASASPTDEANQRLHTVVGIVLATANKASNDNALAASLRPILPQYVSFDAMTRRAIGPGWRQFTPDQQKQAISSFTVLIIRSYASKFTPGEHADVKYKAPVVTAPGRVEIPTTLLYQGNQYEVVYRLEQTEGWRITDIVAEGVSLVANYRSQFDSLFRKGGASEVVSALKQSAASP